MLSRLLRSRLQSLPRRTPESLLWTWTGQTNAQPVSVWKHILCHTCDPSQCSQGLGGNGTCVCDSGFRGSRCQYCSSSNKYGPNCDKSRCGGAVVAARALAHGSQLTCVFAACSCLHGECDNRPDSGGRCKPDSCVPGFTGPFCERRTAACGVQVQFCHAHADCDFSQGSVR